MACCEPKPTSAAQKFNANYRVKPLADKFWSSRNNLTKTIESVKVEHYEKEIEKYHRNDVRCQSKVPRYTNQTYGWLPGYKIRFLQNCDSHIFQNIINQRVAKDLFQHLKKQKIIEPSLNLYK